MMIKRLIIFLVRQRLGLKKNQPFRFSNQSGIAVYYFTSTEIIKTKANGQKQKSNVSLNWLLSDECEIDKLA